MIGRRVPHIEDLVAKARLEISEAFAVHLLSHREAGWTYKRIAEYEGVHPSTARSYIKQLEQRYGSVEDLPPISNAVPLACAVCGERFTSTRADKRFCSNACRQDAYRKRKLGVLTTARGAAAFTAETA